MSDVVTLEIPTIVGFDASPAPVLAELPSQVQLLAVGQQGPAGRDGSPGTSFEFSQSTPSALWTINHNLGFRPVVQIIDAGGNEVDAEITHLSLNTARASFSLPVSGIARCN